MTPSALKTGVLVAAGALFVLMLTTVGASESLSYAPEEIPLPEIDVSHDAFVRQAVTFQSPAPSPASSTSASSVSSTASSSSTPSSTSSSSTSSSSSANSVSSGSASSNDDGLFEWIRRFGDRDRDDGGRGRKGKDRDDD